MNNDARQLAGAAQQYITENTGNVVVSVQVDTQTGTLAGPLSIYVTKITRGTEVGDYDSGVGSDAAAFTMANLFVDGGVTQPFDARGKLIE